MYYNIMPKLTYQNQYIQYPTYRRVMTCPAYPQPTAKPQRVINAEAKLYLYTNPANIINQYKNNPEYQKLNQHPYFNSEIGRINLINIITNLEYAKNRAIVCNFYQPIGYFDGGISKQTENADITECLGNINKLLDNDKISKDIKNYAISNSWNMRYQLTALNAINNIHPDDTENLEKALTNRTTYLYF